MTCVILPNDLQTQAMQKPTHEHYQQNLHLQSLFKDGAGAYVETVVTPTLRPHRGSRLLAHEGQNRLVIEIGGLVQVV